MLAKSKILCVVSALALAACSPSDSKDSETDVGAWPSNIVSEDGDIAFPEGFLDWPTLGAWSTADESGTANGMHQVYATPGTAAAYRETGEFPDGTVLVKEVRGAATANLSTGAATYATDKGVWFVMVKDSKGRFSDNALWGDGWGWALFEAKDPSKQVATDYKKDCIECHIPAKDTDWIYVEAYPVLWKDGKPPIPSWLDGVKASLADDDAPAAMTATDVSVEKPSAFGVCSSCHSTEKGRNGIGPSLAGVFGRKAGSADGYNYSEAMKSSDAVWNAANLDKHLADPKSVVPGNKMVPLFEGVVDAKDRKAIIDYLESI